MKLSVAMITYNHERFIAQAIESVLAQRVNFDYEIVIGEDSSTDLTRAIIMDFHRRYPGRIVPLLRDQNLGIVPNFVGTLTACRGQYLALLEGDDYWTHDDKLQRQVDFLDAHPDSSICCHRVRFLDQTGFAEADIFPPLPAGTYGIEDLLTWNFVMTCSAVLRRDLIGPLPSWFLTMKLGDWPLFALVAKQGKIELMEDIMAAYRVHSGSTWSSRPLVWRLREGSLMLKALDRHLKFQYTETIQQTIASSYLQMSIAARRDGNRLETAKHLLNCLRNGGWFPRVNRRLLTGLAAYVLIGSWYKLFSRAKETSPT